MQRAFETGLSALVKNKEGSVLMAVSGGVDSMVMASLFSASPYKKLAMAHVNFGLRGSDSDADEALVRHWAKSHGMSLYVNKFHTAQYAKEQKISVEMAARALRYQWFEELRQELNMDYIAVAHNANDHAETIILNLIRGTGLRGLCGIHDQRDAIIRPMLDFSRKQIEAYANKMKISYREDATNALLDFSRNRIRHNILPELAKINPDIVARLRENGVYLQQACDILSEQLHAKKKAWCRQEGEKILLNIELLNKEKHAPFWLFEMLRPYGFGSGQMTQIMNLLHAQPGHKVTSNRYVLYKDRTDIALIPYIQNIDAGYSVMFYDSSAYIIKDAHSIAAFDARKLQLPLTMRTWQKGDRFVPLGMKGFKKVSDFLIDAKAPLWEKEHQQVLCSGEDIVWVVGRRIDERYKVNATTQQVAEITLNTATYI